jgi:tyrosine-protein kinase Etk/Wzc
MLSSRAFAELLRQLGQRYDRILIDSPPVMPLADARTLAGICDRTLLVLRAGKSTRKASEDTCAALSGVGARLMGVVVNDVHTRNRNGYGYYRANGNGNGNMRLDQRLKGGSSGATLPSPEEVAQRLS